jgi:hypothetical protein
MMLQARNIPHVHQNTDNGASWVNLSRLQHVLNDVLHVGLKTGGFQMQHLYKASAHCLANLRAGVMCQLKKPLQIPATTQYGWHLHAPLSCTIYLMCQYNTRGTPRHATVCLCNTNSCTAMSSNSTDTRIGSVVVENQQNISFCFPQRIFSFISSHFK